MADVARRNVAEFEQVDVRTLRFEDVESDSFGLVACAQVYHWLDRETRVDRFASLLRPRGAAAIIANVQVTPEDDLPFWMRVQDVYVEHAPDLAHKGEFRKPGDLPPHPLDGSASFDDLSHRAYTWQWTVSALDYAGLLATHSDKAALDTDTRRRLIDAIVELVNDEFDGHVTECYEAVAFLARRR